MDGIKMAANYSYKRVDESCYQHLVDIYEAAFKQPTSVHYYKNKFDTGYLGVKHLGFLAYDENNQPAAFYGVFPYMMEYQGQKYLAAQSGDTMTHPAHTGKGLFTTLGKITYELAIKEGIGFIFGFPNENSYPGFTRKLNWIHKENMNNYEFDVLTLPFAALTKKIRFLSGFYAAYQCLILSFFKPRKPIIQNSAIGLNKAGVHRSDAFFKYKSFYGNYVIGIEDRDFWIKVDGALLVGDIEIKETNTGEEVIKQMKRLAFWLGCTKVIFAVGKETAWDVLLKQSATCKEGAYVGYLDLQSGLPLGDFKFVMADMDIF
jgi:hypothetical protein